MRATKIHTLERGVVARSASESYTTGGCGSRVSPSRVEKCKLLAHGWISAVVTVVAKGVAVGILGVGVDGK